MKTISACNDKNAYRSSSRRKEALIYFAVAIVQVSLLTSAATAAPFSIQGPRVNSNHFRITTFATDLSYPIGMARLTDGSLLVAVSEGASFDNSIGKVIRLIDADTNGVADGSGTVVYTGLPGGQTSLRRGGNLVFVTGQGRGKPITILRAGSILTSALSLVGQININYPSFWYHPHSALLVRDVPATTNIYDLFFQLGSQYNFDPTTDTASLSSSNIAGSSGGALTGTLRGDSIYRLTIIDHGTSVSASNLTHIASGLRNAAGFTFHPHTGDFYFQDNGIDGLSNPNEPLSADELNVIPAASFGGVVEFFGFPTNYLEYRTGRTIGMQGILPLVAFQPLPNPTTGDESEGPNDIVFAPPGFPDGFNNGIFIGFHGRYGAAGLANEENPLVYVDLAATNYFHFIGDEEPNVGHLDGLLATEDSLFIADFTTNGSLSTGSGRGVIYQIKSLVLSPVRVEWLNQRVELTWSYGILQSADNPAGPWIDVPNASNSHSIEVNQSNKFFRTRN